MDSSAPQRGSVGRGRSNDRRPHIARGRVLVGVVFTCLATAGFTLLGASTTASAQTASAQQAHSGRELFVAACANCHGSDGRGATRSQVGFADVLPDFTDCAYSSRETAQDWFAIVHDGGPVRAFSHRMPAFGAALSTEQIERVVAYVRSLCGDRSWPRGELNLPRPMATEKAFPEDETVVTMSAVTQRGDRAVSGALIYEKRFGARNQWELVVPFGIREHPSGESTAWSGAKLGDVALALKRTLYHDGERGTILSAGAEVVLPTGDTASGFGSGTTIIEPFLLAAQALPANSFVQLHGGFESPFDRDVVNRAAFVRVAAGTSLAAGFGRSWSPMVEIIVDRELATGATTEWDWIPQVQVSLSKRQHILANVGMRMPLNRRTSRPRELVAYLIWDWFDGSLFSGW